MLAELPLIIQMEWNSDLLIMTMTNMASGIQAYTFAADPLRIDNNGS